MFATLLFAVLCLLNIILLYFSTTYKNERRCRSFFCLFRYFVLQSNRLKHFVIALFAYIKAVLSSVFFRKNIPMFFLFYSNPQKCRHLFFLFLCRMHHILFFREFLLHQQPILFLPYIPLPFCFSRRNYTIQIIFRIQEVFMLLNAYI